MSETTTKDLARIPQSLAFDYNALTRTYGDEAAIIRDIIVYVSKCQIKNLFGEVEFSIEDFSEEMGYNRTTLQRTIQLFKDNPQKIPIIDNHKFDSPFEYALYRGLKENVIFHRNRQGKETFESVQIIEKLDVVYDKTTKKETKRTYNIKLGAKILDYLFTEYNLIDFNEYRDIRSHQISVTGSMRNFYIFMARVVAHMKYLKKTGVPEQFVLSIDELCEIFSVSIDTPKNKKLYITRTLNGLNKSMINMEFEWKYVKNNTKYAYFVMFEFPDKTLDYFDEQLRAVFYKELYEQLKRTFVFSASEGEDVNYLHEVRNLDKEKYMRWFFQEDANAGDKIEVFTDTYRRVFGIEFDPDNNMLF